MKPFNYSDPALAFVFACLATLSLVSCASPVVVKEPPLTPITHVNQVTNLIRSQLQAYFGAMSTGSNYQTRARATPSGNSIPEIRSNPACLLQRITTPRHNRAHLIWKSDLSA
jgi:hypothetical protein